MRMKEFALTVREGWWSRRGGAQGTVGIERNCRDRATAKIKRIANLEF